MNHAIIEFMVSLSGLGFETKAHLLQQFQKQWSYLQCIQNIPDRL